MQIFETTFERSLTELDWKQNLAFPFQLPGGVTPLHVLLEYSPHEVSGYLNMLTLTVFGPEGWRGSGHRHGDRHEVILGADGATPGYLPGPIQPGEWTVEVDTHMVMPGPPCRMKLSIRADDDPEQQPAARPAPGKTALRGPGWYRGDLHAHSPHSDAGWDIPDLLAFSRARGLDFATLSDHNSVAGLTEMLASSADDLLTMGGMELTTFRGHALALGVHEWVDWRTRPGGRSMDQIAAEVIDQGGLFIIAHPAAPGDPYCTGCDWGHSSLMPGSASAVEVWNMDWRSENKNEEALALAYRWLNQGCRLALTAGADNHGEHPDLKYGFNVVYAAELTEAAILRAIGAGHLYLSSGPSLSLRARAGALAAMMGDALAAPAVPAGGSIRVEATWSGCAPEDRLALVVDGEERERAAAGGEGSAAWQLESGQARWCHVTLRDAGGTMLALTNPIYFASQS